MARKFDQLTRIELRKLKAGERKQEHGICFERLPNGDGIFTINIMVDGQRIHRVIGRESDGTTRKQAEEFIEKARQDAKHDRLALPKGRKIPLSFRDAAGKYLSRLDEEGGKDLPAKRRRLNQHLIEFFGALPLGKIATFDIERYKKHRLNETNLLRPRGKTVKPAEPKHPRPGTINRELAVLSHLMSKAIEWGWIDRRPGKLNRFKEDNSRLTYLMPEQIARMLECAKRDSNPQIHLFILIGVQTAMRRMEILSLRRDDIDVDRRIISIRHAKTGPRQQPMTPALAEFLKEYIEKTLPKGVPWLFPSPAAKSGHAQDIRKPFRRVVKAAGLDCDRVVRHTLRHTAITHLVQSGIDLPTVQRISGHKTFAMVMRYSHANGAHIKAAMERLQERLKVA